MAGCEGSRRGSDRRQFLKATAAAGAGAAIVPVGAIGRASAAEPALPTVILGKTGQKVTRLGMGTSWALQASFVQKAIAAGIGYIDTSETYENTKAESAIGDYLSRNPAARKSIYLVTKTSRYRQAAGGGAAKLFGDRLAASLERLKTDYVDCYYLHGLSGGQINLLSDDGVKAAFETLKKSGKIRFAGLSCHDGRLPEVVEAAAKCGWIDQIMIQYNFRTMTGDDIRKALDVASKANLGIVAMKTQGGAGDFREVGDSPKFKGFLEKGFKKEQAAIKAVLTDERVHAVVSEMTNFDQLKENMASTRDPIGGKEARLLEELREKTAHLYCHGCGHLCETAAKGVPVATVLRYLRYHAVYGKRDAARALYAALPAEARDLGAADLEAAEKACPHGLPVVELIEQAGRRLA